MIEEEFQLRGHFPTHFQQAAVYAKDIPVEQPPVENVVIHSVNSTIAGEEGPPAVAVEEPGTVGDVQSPIPLETQVHSTLPAAVAHSPQNLSSYLVMMFRDVQENLRSMLTDIFTLFSDGLVKKLAEENAVLVEASRSEAKLMALTNECVVASLAESKKDNDGISNLNAMVEGVSLLGVRKQRTVTNRLRKSQGVADCCKKVATDVAQFNSDDPPKSLQGHEAHVL